MIAAFVLAAVASTMLPAGANHFIASRLKLNDYRSAAINLNADRRPEILVYATDLDVCGSGGCTLYVLTPRGNTYSIAMRSTVTQLPIRLLPTSTNGWRDIGVTVDGGGIRKSYLARMRFNGHRYPSNPTLPPAIRVPATGELIISR